MLVKTARNEMRKKKKKKGGMKASACFRLAFFYRPLCPFALFNKKLTERAECSSTILISNVLLCKADFEERPSSRDLNAAGLAVREKKKKIAYCFPTSSNVSYNTLWCLSFVSHGLLDELNSMLTTQITADVCDGDIDRRRISSIEIIAGGCCVLSPPFESDS